MGTAQRRRAESTQPRMEYEPRALVLARAGDYWTVQYAGRVLHVQHAKGMHDLARLVAQPGQDFHVLELIEEGAARADTSLALAGSLQDGLSIRSGGAWDEPLDARARAAYRARYLALVAELDEARCHNDNGRVHRLSAEVSQLLEQLGQRTHVACAATERARKAEYNRLRAALARIARHDCELGRHFDVTVRTGIVCSYRPERASYLRSS